MLYFNKQISSENYNIYCVNSTTWCLIPHAKVILFRKKSPQKALPTLCYIIYKFQAISVDHWD